VHGANNQKKRQFVQMNQILVKAFDFGVFFQLKNHITSLSKKVMQVQLMFIPMSTTTTSKVHSALKITTTITPTDHIKRVATT